MLPTVPSAARPGVWAVLTVLAVLLCQATRAGAEAITFDFNSIGGSSNAAVQDYMQQTLGAGSVTVQGAMATSSYTADGHVVGPVSDGVIVPRALGTTDGGLPHPGNDGFLMNASGSDRITMHFARPIYAVSFDYEIFPNAQVRDGTRTDPHLYPDFTFKADGLTLLHTVAVLPGTAGTFAHSPASGGGLDELAPQFLGHADLVFSGGVTTLEFVDWPVKVGIDNLEVNFTQVAHAPEPSSLALLGCGGLVGLLALTVCRKRRPIAAA
jgi:hypothetical protein